MTRLKKNTNYIFTFGNVGVGKSTIMASIAKLLKETTVLHLNTENSIGNSTLIAGWVSKLDKCKFPPRSRMGSIIEVDLAAELIHSEEKELMKLTFLEMSGEDLNNVSVTQSEGGLEEKFRDYIQASKICLIVTDVENAQEDDLLIWQFLNLLTNWNNNVESVGLIISKWDMLENDYNLENFVKENMSQSYNWLFSAFIPDTKVFKFSIGKTDEDAITEINLNDCKNIVKWIHEKIV